MLTREKKKLGQEGRIARARVCVHVCVCVCVMEDIVTPLGKEGNA